MNFDNSEINYIHLVSYPSIWLPPPKTTKLLVIGCDQKSIDSLVVFLQENHNTNNFAIYTMDVVDWDNPEHVDWLLINQSHCDGTWIKVTDYQSLCFAATLSATRQQISVENNVTCATIAKLIDTANLLNQSTQEFVESMISFKRKNKE